MRRLQLFTLIVVMPAAFVLGCHRGAESSQTSADKVYELRGKIVSLDATKGVVTLDHDDIPGLMKAMKMEFVVENPKLLEGLKEGDQVQGRLEKSAAGHVIVHLEKRADK